MKLKKIISLGLVATLCLSMFAGCGETPPDETQGDGSGDSPTPTVTESPEDGDNANEDARFVENIYDMGGKTITIHDWWNWGFLNDDPTSWSRWESKAAAVIEQIEKDYNVNIKVINDSNDISKDIAVSAAAGEVYANIIVAQGEWTDFVDAGYAADLTTIKNLGIGTNKWDDIGYWDIHGEKVPYGVDFFMETHPAISPTVMIFNKDLAEQYEIEDIYELVRNNEWTYEKFEEICNEIVIKSNGAVKGLLTPIECLTAFCQSSTVTVEDGKYVYNGLSEEVITELEFCRDLVEKGLFDLETFNAPGLNNVGDRTNAFGREHKTLFFMCNWSWALSDVEYRLENYGIAPIPRGPNTDEWVSINGGSQPYYFIEGDPDIEDAAAVLVAIANRLSVTAEEFADYQYTRGYLRDEESYEIFKSMLTDKHIGVPDSWIYLPEGTNNALLNTDITVRQFMEQTAQMTQAALDEKYNQ